MELVGQQETDIFYAYYFAGIFYLYNWKYNCKITNTMPSEFDVKSD